MEQAFQLYADMKEEGVKVRHWDVVAETLTTSVTQIDGHTCSALIATCTRAIERGPPSDRRHHIVLMERAFWVLDDMYRLHIQPDAAVWNALIKTAGRTGMLDRAMQVVRDMHTERCTGDGVTYVSLVDACARAGRTDLAMETYRLALGAGETGCIQLYAAAIGACARAMPADIDTALEIYHDSKRYVGVLTDLLSIHLHTGLVLTSRSRHCVKPDALLFGSLIVAAGRAGQLQLVADLQNSMEAQGVAPSLVRAVGSVVHAPCHNLVLQETHSAVILACTINGDLRAARAAYDAARSQGICPSIQACNSLMALYGRGGRLGEVVTLLADMIRAGLQPDTVTYAAVISTCQRADAAELAFEVVRVMKERGIRMQESHCFVLLRLCYNR